MVEPKRHFRFNKLHVKYEKDLFHFGTKILNEITFYSIQWQSLEHRDIDKNLSIYDLLFFHRLFHFLFHFIVDLIVDKVARKYRIITRYELSSFPVNPEALVESLKVSGRIRETTILRQTGRRHSTSVPSASLFLEDAGENVLLQGRKFN